MSPLAFIALLLQASATPAGAATVPTDAAAYVAQLHDQMLDPTSFVLDNAYVTKPSKRGTVSYCFAFRSHNRMGGYTEGRAVVDGNSHDGLQVYRVDENGHTPGYDTGWSAPCRSRNIDHEITAGLSDAAEKLYKKSR